jgi:hypothetical protein
VFDIYQIKELTKDTSPYFFSKDTLKGFGQRMSDFRVVEVNGRTFIYCKSTNHPLGFGRGNWGYTLREFVPETNELERCPEFDGSGATYADVREFLAKVKRGEA